jgi:hypothetical protein
MLCTLVAAITPNQTTDVKQVKEIKTGGETIRPSIYLLSSLYHVLLLSFYFSSDFSFQSTLVLLDILVYTPARAS